MQNLKDLPMPNESMVNLIDEFLKSDENLQMILPEIHIIAMNAYLIGKNEASI